MFARIHQFIDDHCRKMFYLAYIHNKLDYGIFSFGDAAANDLGPS